VPPNCNVGDSSELVLLLEVNVPTPPCSRARRQGLKLDSTRRVVGCQENRNLPSRAFGRSALEGSDYFGDHASITWR
jgi:hypothetical protein